MTRAIITLTLTFAMGATVGAVGYQMHASTSVTMSCPTPAARDRALENFLARPAPDPNTGKWYRMP